MIVCLYSRSAFEFPPEPRSGDEAPRRVFAFISKFLVPKVLNFHNRQYGGPLARSTRAKCNGAVFFDRRRPCLIVQQQCDQVTNLRYGGADCPLTTFRCDEVPRGGYATDRARLPEGQTEGNGFPGCLHRAWPHRSLRDPIRGRLLYLGSQWVAVNFGAKDKPTCRYTGRARLQKRSGSKVFFHRALALGCDHLWPTVAEQQRSANTPSA